MNRRDFFKIVGATGAAAAGGGCQQAAESILPLVVPNEQLVPGVAAWYATVCRECPAGCGVLARNREGRVVKLEGNPDHPVNQGALCGRGQAALQGLYHPDRFAGPGTPDARGLKPGTWDAAITLVANRIRELRAAGQGRAIALVTQLEHGSVGALLDTWARALGARPRVTLEPFGYEAIRAANRATFGRDAIPYYAFEDAEVVLSFGADFMETWLSTVGYTRAFARMHAFRDGRAGTFVHVEPRQSLTASNADEWVRNAPGTEGLVALAVLRIMVDEGLADRRFAGAVTAVDVTKAAGDSGVPVETLAHIAQVFGHARPGLAVGGGVAVSGSNATATQVAINLLNAAAGNVGKTVRFGPDSAYGRVTPYAEVAELVRAMDRGEIKLLLLGPGVNPAFTLPGGLKFAEAARKAGLVVSFAGQPDETTALAGLVLPDTHWLESWGDYAPREGVTGLLQPTMAPVRDARPMGDVLLAIGRAALGAEEGKGPLPWPGVEQYLKAAWEPVVKGQWGAALQQGGVWRDVAPVAVTAKAAAPAPAPAALEGDAAGFTLLPYPSLRFYDGRGASRAWLQETPDTMTQAVWDAWVEVPAAAAAKLGIAQGDVVRVTSPHGAIELPAYVSPTLHPRAVAIPIGHRYAPYHVPRYTAAPPTPLNPLALLAPGAEAASGGPTFLGVRVTLARTGARRALAILQATHDQDEREIARHVDLRAAREQALRGKAAPEPHVSLYADQRYPGYRWGLAIDLDACVGCQACVVACQAENNVPVVGKAQAAYGRQLHWIRLERWAEGKSDHPAQTFLPMLCQHCEIAPCEPVCPVFAAYRTDEGLNGQVYNRCVGTRYCGNNCPYHVRRFNWFNSEFPAPLEVQLNPDVTVRQLGVMEKCTMCIQRIVAGKDHARDAKRPVKDGDILTACQQTCPTRAITFGNLKDEKSAVARAAHAPRAYHVLDELGTRPSVTYLKKVVRGHGG
ncbi:MAG: 4Fe-4S dicluster domain-containing protein [Candidatus Rokubacteria bacterium]|nr:4Fe-4S dicluster domain-containing protein [Candidatus Rokubacteria bacterium]